MYSNGSGKIQQREFKTMPELGELAGGVLESWGPSDRPEFSMKLVIKHPVLGLTVTVYMGGMLLQQPVPRKSTGQPADDVVMMRAGVKFHGVGQVGLITRLHGS